MDGSRLGKRAIYGGSRTCTVRSPWHIMIYGLCESTESLSINIPLMYTILLYLCQQCLYINIYKMYMFMYKHIEGIFRGGGGGV